MVSPITANLDRIRALCEKHGVVSLWAFGSATRSDFDKVRSDLDFVVEFGPQARSGFDDVFFRLEQDLSVLLGRDVDLIERHLIEQSENPYRRNAILGSLERIYAAA